MNEMIVKTILAATNAQKISHTQVIQELWSGYGEILRVGLIAGDCESIILKHINPPTKGEGKHPRGWDTDFSHERKIKSYKVEIAWYQNWNAQNNIDQDSPTPKCIGSHNQDGEVFMILEDLNSSGYPVRLDTAKWPQIESCLKWLANFHANFLNVKTEDLWETGTYWHLDTRPDELAAIADIEMQEAAPLIDQFLNSGPYQTLVHGDAKLANFCFSNDKLKVAAVDFQYVGGGCGMKDLAYFIGSSLDEDNCQKQEAAILDFYFKELKQAITIKRKDIDFAKLEKSWRALYPYSWCDFHRFLKGWSPSHPKINKYSESIAADVLRQLELGELAKMAALKAGEIISQFKNTKIKVETKEAGTSLASSVVTEVDHLCQQAILEILEPSIKKYDLGLLTEELADDKSRFVKDYFWCIDPLDGTLPFTEGKDDGFAVSIALVDKLGIPIIGVVYDPSTENLYYSIKGIGVYKNGERIEIGDSCPSNKLTLFTDRSFLEHKDYQLYIDALKSKYTELEVVSHGGAVMNACWIIENAPACYFKLPKTTEGGGSLWDFAASSLILQETGGTASDIFGKPIDLNREDSTFLNYFGILMASSINTKDTLTVSLRTIES